MDATEILELNKEGIRLSLKIMRSNLRPEIKDYYYGMYKYYLSEACLKKATN